MPKLEISEELRTAVLAAMENKYVKEYWFIFSLGFFKGFNAPWIPVYRIICMLQKIWRFFSDQFIIKH